MQHLPYKWFQQRVQALLETFAGRHEVLHGSYFPVHRCIFGLGPRKRSQ